jgi:hypothetical protein
MEQITAEYTHDPCFEGDECRGAQLWYVNGVLHRDGDEPAMILTDGTIRMEYSIGTVINQR